MESLKTKLDKSSKENEADKENFTNKITNLETQNQNLKKTIDDLKSDIKSLKANSRKKLQNKISQTDETKALKNETTETQTSPIEVADKGPRNTPHNP